MFLILEDRPRGFTGALAAYAVKLGFSAVNLSSKDLSEGAVSFQINHTGEEFLFEKGDLRIEGTDVDGCFCSINTFSASLWPSFSEDDAEYAAAESHALWLSILHSMKSKMVNNPSPDSLGGKALSPTELYALARGRGLNVPMILYTESSEAVNELLKAGHSLLISNLGRVPQDTILLSLLSPEDLPYSDNCHLVTEVLTGYLYNICLAGKMLFVSTGVNGERPIRCGNQEVPGDTLVALRELMRDLDLKLCEFRFVKTYQGEWVLQNASAEPLSTWLAYGDTLLHEVLNIPLEKTMLESSEINV